MEVVCALSRFGKLLASTPAVSASFPQHYLRVWPHFSQAQSMGLVLACVISSRRQLPTSNHRAFPLLQHLSFCGQQLCFSGIFSSYNKLAPNNRFASATTFSSILPPTTFFLRQQIFLLQPLVSDQPSGFDLSTTRLLRLADLVRTSPLALATIRHLVISLHHGDSIPIKRYGQRLAFKPINHHLIIPHYPLILTLTPVIHLSALTSHSLESDISVVLSFPRSVF
ncbi:hypothetical protein B0T14DRAFT_41978 [Immersiella caudata]|uniref:Uncharacterized protein n=1 Tax=Immersiella caudata TaxID=314043 RepID=A0AA40CC47_9PEZI|nr:hypothetical protein B0T14DRAFT_41978 [Immersiella caudata]